MEIEKLKDRLLISIHALREEGDESLQKWQIALSISIHALREEGDSSRRPAERPESYFYPRPPRGGRHQCFSGRCAARYFYPRPPRGGRQQTCR